MYAGAVWLELIYQSDSREEVKWSLLLHCQAELLTDSAFTESIVSLPAEVIPPSPLTPSVDKTKDTTRNRILFTSTGPDQSSNLPFAVFLPFRASSSVDRHPLTGQFEGLVGLDGLSRCCQRSGTASELAIFHEHIFIVLYSTRLGIDVTNRRRHRTRPKQK